MILDSILEASIRFFTLVYKLFEQYLVNNFINFGRGFEQIFVMLAVTIFVLITIFILIKRVKKLPKSYVIVVLDGFGRKIILKDLRVKFSTLQCRCKLFTVLSLIVRRKICIQGNRLYEDSYRKLSYQEADSTMNR